MNPTNFQKGLERRNLKKDIQEIEFNWYWKINQFQLYVSFVFLIKKRHLLMRKQKVFMVS